MDATSIQQLLSSQKEFFNTKATFSVAFRKEALLKLRKSINQHKPEILAALKSDLGKSEMESFMCEIGLALDEISFMLKHVSKYSRRKVVSTPLVHFPSTSMIKAVPYGNVLIMSPWNYPFLLSIDPLVDAIAAGNTCIVKPSAYSPATSRIVDLIIKECFSPNYIATVTGGRAENTCLLKQKFDYVFFTGSQAVGKEVLRNIAENLTPATLELGGKSPCIVDKSANIKLSAKRIVFGKLLNCGQTCVAPDYIYCHESVKDAFVTALVSEIKKQYGEKPLSNDTYGKIINEKHFNRILSLIDKNKLVFGGASDSSALRIEPTVLDNVTWDDKVMQEEIFGPIMPILTYSSFDELVQLLNTKPKPLAGYLFTSSKAQMESYYNELAFGGGCINDTIIHLSTPQLGFGGFGESGMGAYHGKVGFDTFSHKKSIIRKHNWLDLPVRYQPYSASKNSMIKQFLK